MRRGTAPIVAIVGILTVGLSVGRADAQKSYAIQVSAQADKASSDSIAAALASSGIAPLTVLQKPGDSSALPFKVAVGKFPSLFDAWASQKLSTNQTVRSGFITNLDADPADSSVSVKLPFDTSGLVGEEGALDRTAADDQAVRTYMQNAGLEENEELPNNLQTKPVEQLNRDELIRVGVSARDDARGVQSLNQFIAKTPDDARENKARLRLARRHIRADRIEDASVPLQEVEQSGTPEEKALARFIRTYGKIRKNGGVAAWDDLVALNADANLPAALKPEVRRAVSEVALARSMSDYRAGSLDSAKNSLLLLAGDVQVPTKNRWRALRYAAAAAHRKGEFATSWLTYRFIERNHPDPAAVADARVRLTGLAKELAHRGIGSMKGVERFAEAAAAKEGVTTEARATIELMRLEAIFEQEKYTELLPQVDAYVSQYSAIKRESNTAAVLKGAALVKLGRLEEAKPILEGVASRDIPANERFANLDPRAQALEWLAQGSTRSGDKTAAQGYLDQLSQRFPDSREKERADEAVNYGTQMKQEAEKLSAIEAQKAASAATATSNN
jgi:hypothetical protein